jgi:acylaminoacyl-peptidase
MDILKDQPRANLWMLSSDGSEHRPLTTGPRTISSPALSPDGTRMAYVDKDDAGSQIFLQWLEQGNRAQLTRGSETPRHLTWSPDGRWIAFAMRVPVSAPTMGTLPKAPKGAEWAAPATVIDRMVYRNDGAGYRPEAFYQLFVIAADGGAPRQLTEGPYDHNARLAWTADSSALYFSANRGEDRALNVVNTDIFRLDIETGAIDQLTNRQGPDGSLALSPDGSKIAFLGYDDHRCRTSVSVSTS